MKHKRVEQLSDLDTDLILMRDEVRQCSGCGADTWWRRPRQPKHGICLDCAGVPACTDEVDQQAWSRAGRLLRQAFPGSIAGTDRPVPSAPRWLLLRLWWPVAQRWDQRWVWLSPPDAYRLRGSWTR